MQLYGKTLCLPKGSSPSSSSSSKKPKGEPGIGGDLKSWKSIWYGRSTSKPPPVWFERRCGGCGSGSSGDAGDIGGGGTAVLEAVGAAELATLVVATAEVTMMEDENWHKWGHHEENEFTGNGGRLAKDRQDHRPWPVVLALHRPLAARASRLRGQAPTGYQTEAKAIGLEVCFIEQTAHCKHKPRAAWAFARKATNSG